MNGSLHSLRCTNDPCICEPMRVRVSTSRAREDRYNGMTANEAGHTRIIDGPASVLIPPGPGRSVSRGMRP